MRKVDTYESAASSHIVFILQYKASIGKLESHIATFEFDKPKFLFLKHR